MKLTKKELEIYNYHAMRILYINYGIDFKMPIHIGFKTTKDNDLLAEWNNIYINDTMCHVILINKKAVKDYADLIDCILHELIHALQYEKNKPVLHNKFFCKYVVKLAKHGYNIGCNEITIKQLEKATKNEN